MDKLLHLAAGARQLGLQLTDSQLAQFVRYRAELLEWNQRFNLISDREAERVETRHFLDSLFCLRADVPVECQLLDVGSGAGFPGLALKIVRPDIRLTLVEATGKKAGFLKHVASVLGLRDVEVLPRRAEELDRRETFDLVVARALAALRSLLELTLPFCRVGGRVLAMKKGEALAAEVDAAQRALAVLGGELGEPVVYELEDERREIVVVRKTRPTPSIYPRRAGMPVKHPL